MLQLGENADLLVLDTNRESITLDGQNLGPVQLPTEEAPKAEIGQKLSVFVYTDAQANAVATIDEPKVKRGHCASLKVVDITNAGAFLDWGLEKNLLLPFAEQRRPLEIGRHESVLVYLDNSGRLAASSRLDHHLPETADNFKPWQAVSLLIFQRTDLGMKAVVDNRAIGLIYKDEIFKPVRVGENHTGYVKRLRHDGRIDLALQPPSKQVKPELSHRILDYLQDNDGICHLSDKSSPDAIQLQFQVSKKNFKKAISQLYKERKIVIHPDHIELVKT